MRLISQHIRAESFVINCRLTHTDHANMNAVIGGVSVTSRLITMC